VRSLGGWVVSLYPTGGRANYSTRFPGNVMAVAADDAGSAYVVGNSSATIGLITTAGAFQPTSPSIGLFGFVSKIAGSIPAGPAPQISAGAVLNGASFQGGLVSGSWFAIQGSNLSRTTNTWANAIVDGRLPTALDGVTVDVGGRAAYIYYVSPTQINAIAPDLPAGTLSTTVVVRNSNGASSPATVGVFPAQPAFFLWPGSQPVAIRQDASFAVKNGTFSGVTTIPAKPGDVLILWGTGFGPTTPAAPSGVQIPATQTYLTSTPVTVTIGGRTAQVFGTALSPGFAGLYQVAIQVPAGLANGDHAIVATINNLSSPSSTLLTVQQ
jgi:uncharacterized protein (TIGR03437 family)